MSRNLCKGILYVSVTAVLWSFVAIALKIAIRECDAETINWFRFSFAFVLLAIYYLFTDRKRLMIIVKPPFILFIASVGLGINYYGYLMGVHYTSPSTTQIVIQVAPALFALSGFIFFNEKTSIKQLTGFIITIAGLAIFYNRQSLHLSHDIQNFNSGIIWTLIAALGWTLYAILQKKAAFDQPVLQMNLIIFGFPALFFSFFANYSVFAEIGVITWLLLIFLGLNTLVSYVALSAGLKYIEANRSSVIITLNPILTFLMMVVLEKMNTRIIEGEHFSYTALAGAVMVMAGCIIVVGSKTDPKK